MFLKYNNQRANFPPSLAYPNADAREVPFRQWIEHRQQITLINFGCLLLTGGRGMLAKQWKRKVTHNPELREVERKVNYSLSESGSLAMATNWLGC